MPFKKVIIINGTGGCGKSTFVKICQKIGLNLRKEDQNLIVYELSTVDWPKEVAKFCGWEGGKTEKDRKFLYDLKKVLEKWDDSPTNFVLERMQKLIEKDPNKNYLFFVNIREIYNIVRFKQVLWEKLKIECEDLLIKNENIPLINSNPADAGVFVHNYDYVILNNEGLNELEKEAENFLEKVFYSIDNEEKM